MAEFKEGWNYLINSRKWHYFVDRRSLCGRWAMFFGDNHDAQLGDNDSPVNCAACRRAVEKREKDDARTKRVSETESQAVVGADGADSHLGAMQRPDQSE